MSVLKILTIPDPILESVSLPVKEISSETKIFISNMINTMGHHKNCIGLAAPQVGKLNRIIVIDVSIYSKPCPNHGRLVLINPVIKTSSEYQIGREGCLSIPDFTGNVSRAQNITVEATDQHGNPKQILAKGFEAVVLQHEIDHLDGILFLNRVASLKTDIFRRKKY